MKFQDLPKDAQHHALSTLRELMVVGDENKSGVDIAAKVKAAFVSMYSEAEKTTHTMNISFNNAPIGEPVIEKSAQTITPLPCGGVDRVYHDTMVKCLKIEIEKLKSKIAVNEIVAN